MDETLVPCGVSRQTRWIGAAGRVVYQRRPGRLATSASMFYLIRKWNRGCTMHWLTGWPPTPCSSALVPPAVTFGPARRSATPALAFPLLCCSEHRFFLSKQSTMSLRGVIDMYDYMHSLVHVYPHCSRTFCKLLTHVHLLAFGPIRTVAELCGSQGASAPPPLSLLDRSAGRCSTESVEGQWQWREGERLEEADGFCAPCVERKRCRAYRLWRQKRHMLSWNSDSSYMA
jgi:hypothetical protein